MIEIADRVDNILRCYIKEGDAKITIKNKLTGYVNYLCSWLKVHNVVSRRNGPVDIWENIYDSVAFLLETNSKISQLFSLEVDIVDAGSGGGFPGLPLAIIF